MKKALTRKQKESYQCILNYMKEHGYPPTVREFGELIGVKSTSSASQNLLITLISDQTILENVLLDLEKITPLKFEYDRK